jgi:hypothetical protein
MAVAKKLLALKEWYARHSVWVGWLGIALVAASFVVKEILPEHYKAQGEEITKSVATLDADDAEKRQVADTRSYGADKPDVLDSILVRLEATEKLCSNDGYYIARIERLDKNDEIAHSGFLASKHLSEALLENVAKTLFTRSFTAMVNIGELKKEGKSRGPAVSGHHFEEPDP